MIRMPIRIPPGAPVRGRRDDTPLQQGLCEEPGRSTIAPMEKPDMRASYWQGDLVRLRALAVEDAAAAGLPRGGPHPPRRLHRGALPRRAPLRPHTRGVRREPGV